MVDRSLVVSPFREVRNITPRIRQAQRDSAIAVIGPTSSCMNGRTEPEFHTQRTARPRHCGRDRVHGGGDRRQYDSEDEKAAWSLDTANSHIVGTTPKRAHVVAFPYKHTAAHEPTGGSRSVSGRRDPRVKAGTE